MNYEIIHRELPSRDSRLKRHVHHDSRSRHYAFPTAGLTIQSAVHSRHIPILDQGQVGSCTGNAGIGNLGTDPIFPLLNPNVGKYRMDEDGAIALYSDAEVFDGDGPYPPQDNGSSGLSIASVLKKAGIIPGYQHTFSLTDCLKALSVTPVMLGIPWFEDMFSPDADGRLHITGALAGGHEIECREVDATLGRVWIDNSWGLSFGIQGRAYLTFNDLGALLSQQGDVTVLLPSNAPKPVPIPPAPKTYTKTIVVMSASPFSVSVK